MLTDNNNDHNNDQDRMQAVIELSRKNVKQGQEPFACLLYRRKRRRPSQHGRDNDEDENAIIDYAIIGKN